MSNHNSPEITASWRKPAICNLRQPGKQGYEHDNMHTPDFSEVLCNMCEKACVEGYSYAKSPIVIDLYSDLSRRSIHVAWMFQGCKYGHVTSCVFRGRSTSPPPGAELGCPPFGSHSAKNFLKLSKRHVRVFLDIKGSEQ